MDIGGVFRNGWFEFILGRGVEFIIGWEFYVGGYKKLRNGGGNMDVVVGVGRSGGYF
ncbi:hypothetical protein [Staphylococcus aureus]|uniref:hypothetical protein n=1 Tax=Staphylococcus aureus TaxID=1280 RepID=UPI001642A8AA|nr:hypothetical protein [Staphylococcus aureus]